MFPSASQQSTLYGFPDVSFASQPFPSDASLAEPRAANPADEFKRALHLAQAQLTTIAALARSVQAGIEHAYQPHTNPLQTAADAAALKQALHELAATLAQTGVGALPLLDPSHGALPGEDVLLADTAKAIEAEYAKQRRLQEGAATVVNLLNAVDQSVKR